jgi:integrator complex subunit 6
MLILFLVDTSSSMVQKTHNGLSLLDICKTGIEHFIKTRNKDPNGKNDRYFLVTCEDSSKCIKSGWKDSFHNFTNELKNLEAKSLTQIGPALAESFNLLNQYRLQTNIDNYGQV